jgi:putative membrane protein
MSTSFGTRLLDGARGALIGTAEVVPGVSGGTVAMITGVYEPLITSAGHVLTGTGAAAAALVRRRPLDRARAEFGRVRWGLVAAVLAGMVAAVLVAARLLEPLVEEHRPQAFAVFFGLVAASLWVPFSRSGGAWRPGQWLLAAVSAVAAFLLTGLPAAVAEPHPLSVAGGAAVAVSALVLPGVSGALVLEALGLYDATLGALNDRDLGYVGTFALGAVLGLACFVTLLRWLLERHHRTTLVVITGLMAGALRALWPWQHWEVEGDRSLLAPTTDVPATLALMAVGAGVVVAVLWAERRSRPRGTRGTAGSAARSGREGGRAVHS